MILSTGREVIEYKERSGSTFVEIKGGAQVTEAEWQEYCAYLRALSLEQSRARLRNRQEMIAPELESFRNSPDTNF